MITAKANGSTVNLVEMTDTPTPMALDLKSMNSVYSIVPANCAQIYRQGCVAMLRVSGGARIGLKGGNAYWIDDLYGPYIPVAAVTWFPVNGGHVVIAPKTDHPTNWEAKFTPSSDIAAGGAINFQVPFMCAGN